MSTSLEPQTPPSSSAPKPWAASPEEVLASVDSTTDGLAGSEVEKRLARDGRNELPTPKPVPAWRRLLSQFNDILIYILLAAAALKAALGEWIDFWVILTVALINAVIGFVQEGRAEQALAGIENMLSAEAQVRLAQNALHDACERDFATLVALGQQGVAGGLGVLPAGRIRGDGDDSADGVGRYGRWLELANGTAGGKSVAHEGCPPYQHINGFCGFRDVIHRVL